MNICVIGGTGNISTSIVRTLLEQGHEVTCYNRGESGKAPGVRTITGDRKDRETFEQTMRKERFDAAIDMICFTAEDAQSDIRAFPEIGQFVHCSTVCTYGIKLKFMPAPEDHPLEPISDYGRNKVAADAVFLAEYHRNGFPVTIIKPSTTYGPKMGLLRQISTEPGWLDRVRKGKPIIQCGDGITLHQFLHVDDAALGFAGVLGKNHCVGQTYNLTKRGFTTWEDYHRTAMRVIGREVELINIPFSVLDSREIPGFGICRDVFAHNSFYSSERISRHVPEFTPSISLESGMSSVLQEMDAQGRVPDSDQSSWEDQIIDAFRH